MAWSWSASVAKLTHRPSEPMSAQGWRPPIARFWRTARAVPRVRMNEGRVVDVVAHVVLVEAHGAVMSERQILRVNQIDRLARGADVLDGHVPEPGGCRARQHERHLEADPLPLAMRAEPALVEPHHGGAARSEQRSPLDPRCVAAQVEVRRPSFHLRAGKEVEEDVPVIDAPDRAVRVQLHAEARRALEQTGSAQSQPPWNPARRSPAFT